MSYREKLAIGLLLAAASSPLKADLSLKFGVYTADKATTVVAQFRPVLDALESVMSRSLGEPVNIKMHIAKSYDQGVQDIASEEVDFSRLGPASYVKAKDINSGLSILAVESEQGTKTFYGVICVRADSPIQDIAGLKGKSFAFADRNSTIGRYLSQLYLIEHGIKASDLAHYAYLGRHDKVGTAVGMGQFHAGALKENTFNTLVAKGVPIRAIAKFPNVTKPWVARSGLSQRVHGALREALLNLREASALKALGAEGFLEGQDEDYAATREAIHSEHLFEGPSPQVSLSVPSNEGHAGSQ